MMTPATSLGSLFQCLITLLVNKFFLLSSLKLPWRNLKPFPLVLSLVTWEKRLTPTDNWILWVLALGCHWNSQWEQEGFDGGLILSPKMSSSS